MGQSQSLPRPELMAIGDSLYNGVRSLSITQNLSSLSAPALVAEGLGLGQSFFCPDYEQPLLIDFERYLKLLPLITKIKADLWKNFQYWIHAPKPASGRTFFDNIAIASTVYKDLYTRTAATAEKELQDLGASAFTSVEQVIKSLDLLSFALNTRFVLNPLSLPELQDKTMLDLVALRHPKTLLVNIGSNDGLWSMGFDASAQPRYEGARPALDTLIDKLAALPEDMAIYFNGLALPSTVANLMPPSEEPLSHRPPPGGYYDEYDNAFRARPEGC